MNKKMRDLLAQMEAKRKSATTHLEDGDTQKAQAVMTEIDDLKAQYEIAEKLFKDEQAGIPDGGNTGDTSKKASGFEVIAKMLKKVSLNDTEKALITGGSSGENNLIPEDVDLAIRELRKQYKSAKNLVTVIPTDTLSGSFNFESGTPAGLAALTDGNAVADETNPTFARKSFAIKLYAKMIAISNILKGAEKSGLMAYLNKWFIKNAIITENTAIFTALKTGKSVKALKGLSALKTSLNKDLDPDALIGAVIVTNQTGFDAMDSETDAAGNPLLTTDLANPTMKRFKGIPIEVFSDAQLPNVSGKAPIFYGALDAGCYFIEMMGLEFATSDQFLFNKNQIALRVIEGFDVIQADTNTYIYGTFEPADPKVINTKVTNTTADPVNTKAVTA